MLLRLARAHTSPGGLVKTRILRVCVLNTFPGAAELGPERVLLWAQFLLYSGKLGEVLSDVTEL